MRMMRGDVALLMLKKVRVCVREAIRLWWKRLRWIIGHLLSDRTVRRVAAEARWKLWRKLLLVGALQAASVSHQQQHKIANALLTRRLETIRTGRG